MNIHFQNIMLQDILSAELILYWAFYILQWYCQIIHLKAFFLQEKNVLKHFNQGWLKHMICLPNLWFKYMICQPPKFAEK